ncbi:hypothetical protein O3P69_002191 [Scylla paramamosain]|uniref:Uncharacterized protein n=1 Tax=Scylla paramamosain TaxID=85552 RepID=A0AAW0V583_SCYPA
MDSTYHEGVYVPGNFELVSPYAAQGRESGRGMGWNENAVIPGPLEKKRWPKLLMYVIQGASNGRKGGLDNRVRPCSLDATSLIWFVQLPSLSRCKDNPQQKDTPSSPRHSHRYNHPLLATSDSILGYQLHMHKKMAPAQCPRHHEHQCQAYRATHLRGTGVCRAEGLEAALSADFF